MARRQKPTRAQLKLNRAAGLDERTGRHSQFNGNTGVPSPRRRASRDPARIQSVRERQAVIAERHRKRGVKADA